MVYTPGYNCFRVVDQVVTVHDLIHLRTEWPMRAKYLAYYQGVLKPAIRRSGVVITVSETSREAIREWLRDDDVEVVNAGIGCSEEFNTRGLWAEDGPPYALFVGNARPHKNLITALNAVAAAPGMRMKAVVPAREQLAVADLAHRVGVGDRIDWLSGVSDEKMATLYRGASVTLVPSILEGFGLPALESIKCGTPVAFWEGCSSVAEIVGTRGFAISKWDDHLQLAEVMMECAESRISVEPPSPGEYSWELAAESVSDVLSRQLDRAAQR
ncbi:glycosyltransferase [Microbacterium memoriense]|uniref:Glycosyltransferase n=1 Tax=Microbacterium memoriense TaxID=2978350 RepID=A0ABT2PDC8_9MICO|nr:glycosyltransferase [Microbacterium memoriense]MCT9001814.1 glycosyltransferase [Microbacterium memoriense]